MRTHPEADDRAAPVRPGSGDGIVLGIAKNLGELARDLQAVDDPRTLMQRLVDAAVLEIEGAEHAGITVAGKLSAQTEAKTSVLTAELDDLQYRLGDGPCMTSLREHHTVRADDLTTEDRWPNFAAAAVDYGVLSSLSVRLFIENDDLGALNLYSPRINGFSEADEGRALLLASHASVAIAGARKIQNLEIALGSRDVIGQAKGILMERYKFTADEAFALLITASQRAHRKLAAIAEELTMTGELALHTELR